MADNCHPRAGGGPEPQTSSHAALDSRLRGNDDSFSCSATQLAGLATALFHWPPDIFWQTTPAELAALLAALAPDTANPATPETLATLMEQFPD